ncbi:MAG: exodeoxyribonuclease gamma subunit, partial [Kribbellaceae bacterium]|nr:exodeoxyribonuclease gamma subunit [Kribbellaceae bacterium]
MSAPDDQLQRSRRAPRATGADHPPSQRGTGATWHAASVTLYLHRAERTDVLADGLGDLLAVPLADPFAEELVVVPAKGVERWLS